MKKIWKAAIIGGAVALGAAAAAAGAAYAAAKIFVREAMDREEPPVVRKAKSLIGARPAADALEDASEAAAEQLKAADTERVEISAWDGVKLVGHLRRGEEPKRVIIAMHGWRSSWYKDFGASAGFLHDNGCTVLYAEQRGQGESGGDAMAFGLLECRDCLAWIDWLNKNGAADRPVYLAGLSMGATTVLLAAGLALPENVRGVIADCGFTSAGAIWRHVAENSWHLPYRQVKPLLDRLCREKIHFVPDAGSTVEAMKNAKVPVLFIHGLDDSFVPPAMTEENYAACAAAGKRLLLVPGARHGMSYMVARERYEAEMKEFWNDCEEAGA